MKEHLPGMEATMAHFTDLLGGLTAPPVGRCRRISSNEQPNDDQVCGTHVAGTIAPRSSDKSPGESAGVFQNDALNSRDDSFQRTSMTNPHGAKVAALLVSQGIKHPA